MRLSLFILASSLLLSCNNIPEAILLANTEKVDTLDVNEYTHVIDKKNRRGYVTAENEVMNGRYVITREGTMTQEKADSYMAHSYNTTILARQNGLKPIKKAYSTAP